MILSNKFHGRPCRCGSTLRYTRRGHHCVACQTKAVANAKNRLKKFPDATPKPDTCDCCGRFAKQMVLDHQHDPERFRGWLCHNCNLAIGHLGDTLEGVMRAADYLRRTSRS